ncbi:MAG: serine/threonine-protein kinase [Planctomycetota bacterium]
MSDSTDNDPTLTPGPPPERPEASKPGALPESGETWAGRYRIVSKLGQGGAGTVFRAQDLELQEAVAIKFLKENALSDPAQVELLRNEVRTARLVSHANVCRVHDLGVVDGHAFLTMEFVEGEDLGSLIRRIGRIPTDKALEIATQVGGGLRAAHERGIIHRDLKPGNVMIDANGDVRLTDFGLAGHVRTLEDEVSIGGTPAYMAPELFRGETPSVESDIYAFGILLYELLTGERPFRGSNLQELRAAHESPIRPSLEGRIVDVNPQIERVLTRCLSIDPRQRPHDLVEVLAELPGWDPLRESLSRGETPSPGTVASARGSGEISPERVPFVVATVAVLVLLTFGIVAQRGLLSRTDLPLGGGVLAEDSRRILEALGHGEDPGAADSRTFEVWAFDYYEELVEELRQSDDVDRWDELESKHTSILDFYYRRSPEPIVPSPGTLHLGWDEPPIRVPGMVQVRLAPDGRLREFLAVPEPWSNPVGLPSTTPRVAIDWRAVLELAGLQIEDLAETLPLLRPQVFATERFAWRGRYPDSDDPIQVEASTLDGRIASFRVLDLDRLEASLPSRMEHRETASRGSPNPIFNWFSAVMYLGTLPFAWNSIRQRRVDVRGANRCAIFMGLLVTLATYLMADHAPDVPAEIQLITGALVRGLVRGAMFWLLYAGYEPHVRRIWPEILVSWTRLFQRRFGDRLVWSNALVGIGIGAGMALMELSYGWTARVLDIPGPPPVSQDLITAAALDGPVPSLGAMLQVSFRYFGFGMMSLMALVMLRLLIRRKRTSYLIAILVLSVLFASGSRLPIHIALPAALLQSALNTWGIVRNGLLGLACGTATFGVLLGMPSTLELDRWYAGSGYLVLAVIGAALISSWVILKRR